MPRRCMIAMRRLGGPDVVHRDAVNPSVGAPAAAPHAADGPLNHI